MVPLKRREGERERKGAETATFLKRPVLQIANKKAGLARPVLPSV